MIFNQCLCDQPVHFFWKLNVRYSDILCIQLLHLWSNLNNSKSKNFFSFCQPFYDYKYIHELHLFYDGQLLLTSTVNVLAAIWLMNARLWMAITITGTTSARGNNVFIATHRVFGRFGNFSNIVRLADLERVPTFEFFPAPNGRLKKKKNKKTRFNLHRKGDSGDNANDK